jgi:hypothetical protein
MGDPFPSDCRDGGEGAAPAGAVPGSRLVVRKCQPILELHRGPAGCGRVQDRTHVLGACVILDQNPGDAAEELGIGGDGQNFDPLETTFLQPVAMLPKDFVHVSNPYLARGDQHAT